MRERIRKLFGTTSSRNGAYSVGLITLVVLIVIMVNLIAARLPENVKSIDISDNRIYEITDTSRELLENLKDDVTLTVYAEKSSTDEILKRFLDRYTALSDKISVTWVDPVLHPSQLTDNGVTEGDILISCPETGRSKIVNIDDILIVDEYAYYYYGSTEPTEFDGEGQLTSAINYVTNGEEKVVYCLTGHGEGELSSSVTDLFNKNNIVTEDLNLLMDGEIPDSCNLILINGATSDLTEEETGQIQDYMQSGGQVVILLSGAAQDTPNLDDLLLTYGLKEVEGYIADMERSYQGNYFYIFPEIVSSDEALTQGLSTGMVLLVDSRGMEITDAGRDTITVDEILTSSSNSYAVTEETEELTDPQTFVLGAVATETVAGTVTDEGEDTGFAEDVEVSDESESRLTVFASETLIDSQITDYFSTLENLDLFMNAVLAGFDDVENVAIEAKSLEVTYNTMQHIGVISLLTVIGIPLVIVIFGFVRWWRRRRA